VALAKLVTVGAATRIDSEVLATTVAAKVTAIGPLTTDPSDAGSGSGGQDATAPSGTPYVPITITPDQAVPPAWNGQDVRVTISSAKTAAAVLAVPIAAITSRADGQSVVTVVDADGGTTQVVVRAGVSADGLVQVTPVEGHLAAGDWVSVGQ
jgi:hypothetical protein